MPIPSQRRYDSLHDLHQKQYAEDVRKAYVKAINEISKLAKGVNLNVNDEFYFRNHPKLNKAANEVIKTLNDEVYGSTVAGINTEWDLAVEKNNDLALYVFGDTLDEIPRQYRTRYLSNNAGARRSFKARRDGGLGLSEKVWKNTRQFKNQLELALEAGIGQGKSAAKIARDTKQYLNDPDKLFRRIRDKKTGELRLSKAAKNYHPGPGRYRSSYKNALRLTAQETSASYETSQNEKRKQQDFIVGITIKVSPSHKKTDDKGGICCYCLQGPYPKDFNWNDKWHVKCKCTSFNILKTREELDKDIDKILAGGEPNTGSVNQVSKAPEQYNSYLQDNRSKWKNWKNPPRWVTANEGIPKVPVKTTTPTVKAATPTVKTPTPKKVYAPEQLRPDGPYLKDTGVTLNDDFFKLIDPEKPITLRINNRGDGSYFQPGRRLVSLGNGSRAKASPWEREAVVYHEYGHALDWQEGLKSKLTGRLDELRKELNKAGTKTVERLAYDRKTGGYIYKKKAVSRIAEIDDRLKRLNTKAWRLKPETYKRLGITKSDFMEQIGSTMDTVMAINPNYGHGHSKAYFKGPGKREAEFIAHAFENNFAGNAVFKKVLPELYEEMIQFVKQIKPKQ